MSYIGLTIVLSNPSRYDMTHSRLLSAGGGHVMNDFCLRPDYNVMQCDVRLADDKSPWLDGTKCILLLGQDSLHQYVPEARNNTLNEVRGSVYEVDGIPCIASFFPQDAADIKSYEQTLNKDSKEYVGEDSEQQGDDDDDDEYDSAKKHGRTKRANYAFWLRADTRKAKHILMEGMGCVLSRRQPAYINTPNSTELCQVLESTKGKHLYFDIETDYEEANLQCFSFTFDGETIYNVPFLDYNYKPAYSANARILRSLAVAIRDNTLVAHNGANFDFFVLGYKYRIPVYKVYDTMIAMHRCFPDIEKSLGHCTSYWTWERFHKDEDSEGYMTQQQQTARMKYCGKDVYTMYLIHQAIEKYAKTIPGLSDSIATAMSHIVPYLITSLQGIRYNEKILKDTQHENDQLMTQYIRIINMLIGEAGIRDIRAAIRGKAKGFPGSNTQCCEYFHNILGYPVVARSAKTGAPSLGKKAMFKLALKHDNPVIRFVLAYRILAKEYGTLKFVPWKDDNNEVVNIREWCKVLH